jgi:putative addiction module component (TIGR02574 family)
VILTDTAFAESVDQKGSSVMSILSAARIRELTPAERIELIEQLWESFVEDPAALPVTAEQLTELRERLAEHERNPEAAKPWSAVRAELERE